MEIVAVIAQILIALTAVAALVVSILAFRRSNLSDRQEHEHRDVSWGGEWVAGAEGFANFVLENTGTTVAKKVRAQVKSDPVGPLVDALNLGTFQPGDKRVILSRPTDAVEAVGLLVAVLELEGAPFTVNWVSPLGKPERFERG